MDSTLIIVLIALVALVLAFAMFGKDIRRYLNMRNM